MINLKQLQVMVHGCMRKKQLQVLVYGGKRKQLQVVVHRLHEKTTASPGARLLKREEKTNKGTQALSAGCKIYYSERREQKKKIETKREAHI